VQHREVGSSSSGPEDHIWGYTRIRGALRNPGTSSAATRPSASSSSPASNPHPRARGFLGRPSCRRTRGQLWGRSLHRRGAPPSWARSATVYSSSDIRTPCVQFARIVSQPRDTEADRLRSHRQRRWASRRCALPHSGPTLQRRVGDILRGTGVRCFRLPADRPDLNAYAERFVLSIKSECLDRLVHSDGTNGTKAARGSCSPGGSGREGDPPARRCPPPHGRRFRTG